ncbi:DgyrCDS6479 [Dimorphilus gyrociliatus]|uniref:DgyrCDS6479 n=1 Tax=Dimorphilus gyrociliatus TaxID=2664684 RepID=A0A7I8VSY6_9ANNE|nr:DgyrCDS6479 [Dimorphilus gyrociliatus]
MVTTTTTPAETTTVKIFDLTPTDDTAAPFVEKVRFPESNIGKVTIKRLVPASEKNAGQYETVADNETPTDPNHLEEPQNDDDTEYKLHVAIHACFKVKVTTTTQPPTTTTTTAAPTTTTEATTTTAAPTTTTTTTAAPTTTMTTTAAPTTTTEATTTITVPSTTTVTTTTTTTPAPTTTEATTTAPTTTSTTAAPTTTKTTTTTTAAPTTTTVQSTTTMSVKPTEGTTTTPAIVTTTTTAETTTTKMEKIQMIRFVWVRKAGLQNVPTSSDQPKPTVEIKLNRQDDPEDPYVEKVIVKGNAGKKVETLSSQGSKDQHYQDCIGEPTLNEDGTPAKKYKVNIGISACISYTVTTTTTTPTPTTTTEATTTMAPTTTETTTTTAATTTTARTTTTTSATTTTTAMVTTTTTPAETTTVKICNFEEGMDEPQFIPAGQLESSPETTDKENNPLTNLRPKSGKAFVLPVPKKDSDEKKPFVTVDLTPTDDTAAPFVEKVRFPESNIGKVTIKRLVPASEKNAGQYETVVTSQKLDDDNTIKFTTPVRMDKIQIILEEPQNDDDTEYKLHVAIHACFKVKITTTTQPPTTTTTNSCTNYNY